MRFLKEYFIIIIILAMVFVIENITSKSLEESINWMSNGITSIENKMNENKEYEAQKEFYELEEKWNGNIDTLALFVEHNELEKISNDVVIIESNFETNEKEKVMENIAELKFMLSHIGEKNKLKLKNIF